MQQIHFIQKLYNQYYFKNAKTVDVLKNIDINKLLPGEREKLTEKYMQEGELLLAKKNTNAIAFFNAAAGLSPNSVDVWLRQGKAFLSYGQLKNQEKALYLASKNFKLAISLDDTIFEAWHLWGKTLSLLGDKTTQTSHYQSAKIKYDKALKLIDKTEKTNISEIYREYGNLWMNIACDSQEAGDVKLAIQAFRKALSFQTTPSSDFYCDFGAAYLQMALFINDNRLYYEAIDYFKKSLKISENHFNSHSFLAHAYTELYINTTDETCLQKALEAYEKTIKISPSNSELLLEYSQLLCEAGKLNSDTQKIKIAYEKCTEAHRLDKKNLYILSHLVETISLLGQHTNNLDLLLKAEKIITDKQLQFKIPELWYSYGICLNSFADYYDDIEYTSQAIEKFYTALSLDQTNPEILNALAFSFAKIGYETLDETDLKQASKFYLRALDLKPACSSLSFEYGKFLLKKGDLTDDKSSLEKALFYLRNSLNNQKNTLLQHPDRLFAYGQVLDLLGDCSDEENSFYEKSLQAFKNVLLIDPDYPNLYYHIGLCHSHLGEIHLNPQFFQQAIKSFSLAIKQNEENDLAYLEWGLATIFLAEQSQIPEIKNEYYKTAEERITKAGNLGNQHAYYHLACLYSILNRLEESMTLLIKAQKLEILPSLDELMEDDWLENLRSTPEFYTFHLNLKKNQNIVDGL